MPKMVELCACVSPCRTAGRGSLSSCSKISRMKDPSRVLSGKYDHVSLVSFRIISDFFLPSTRQFRHDASRSHHTCTQPLILQGQGLDLLCQERHSRLQTSDDLILFGCHLGQT